MLMKDILNLTSPSSCRPFFIKTCLRYMGTSHIKGCCTKGKQSRLRLCYSRGNDMPNQQLYKLYKVIASNYDLLNSFDKSKLPVARITRIAAEQFQKNEVQSIFLTLQSNSSIAN